MQSSSNKTSIKVYTSELLKRRWLSGETFEIELTRPPSFEFVPGQRIRLIHADIERDYSLITTPADSTLTLCIRHVQGGGLSSMLASNAIGTHLKFSGPQGYFTFKASPRPKVFVATGTGIAPFVSMASSGVTGFTLLHGVRMSAELYYCSLFQNAAQLYVSCLSGISTKSSVPGKKFFGRVTTYLERHLTPSSYDFYLCGREEMIRDVTLLVDERFPESFVYTEIFF
jgi:ferredoxin-NADP reductase